MQPDLFTHSPRFDGADYSPERDQARLTAQQARIRDFMADGAWHTLREISRATGDPEASISAQLRALKQRRHGAHQVGREFVGGGLYRYRVQP